MPNLWKIEIASHTSWMATCNDRSVELAYPPRPGIHRLEITWHRSTQIHTFDLMVRQDVNRIVLKSHARNEVSSETEGTTISLQERGFIVDIANIGRTSYRAETNDIETSDFANDEWESAMVWLVGTLKVIGFPAMLD